MKTGQVTGYEGDVGDERGTAAEVWTVVGGVAGRRRRPDNGGAWRRHGAWERRRSGECDEITPQVRGVSTSCFVTPERWKLYHPVTKIVAQGCKRDG